MIEVRNLSKKYDDKTVVHNISLKIEKESKFLLVLALVSGILYGLTLIPYAGIIIGLIIKITSIGLIISVFLPHKELTDEEKAKLDETKKQAKEDKEKRKQEKLEAKANKKKDQIEKSEFWGLLLFVGIPLPGTGAWTGTLAASILDMDFKSSVLACMGGVLLAGLIMGIASTGVLGIIGTLF